MKEPASQMPGDAPGDAMDVTYMLEDCSLSVHGKVGCDPILRRLIERAIEGDASAFENIMLRHQRRVVSIAWRMLGNEEDARDAAQDAFFRVFKYLRSYKPSQDFDGWLYRIVINVCRDITRKRPPRSVTSFESEAEIGEIEAIASDDDVERSAMRSEQRRMIAAALESLSAKEREALVLRDLEGFSTSEVARMLGSSQTTVRSQISSARTKIKAFRDRLLRKPERRGQKNELPDR